jgi:FkbM family methyltransferase
LGSQYGGWHVPTSIIAQGSVCYCVGVGEDATFDLALAERGCEVHAFDPTPRSIIYVEGLGDRPGFHFHPVGVWSREETLRFFAPHNPEFVSHSVKKIWHSDDYFEADCRPLGHLMAELGHTSVDLIKLDIEGAEIEVLQNVLEVGIRPSVIAVEFDQPSKMVPMVLRLLRSGYELVHIERWNYTFVLRETAQGRRTTWPREEMPSPPKQ